MDLKKITCNICQKISANEILKCKNAHLYCIDCLTENQEKCPQCGFNLKKDKNEEIVNLLSSNRNLTTNSNTFPCKYEDQGCDWTFPSKSVLMKHIEECKYQKYNCIGKTFKAWKCSWTNCKHNIRDHMLQDHKKIINKIYSHDEKFSVYFRGTSTNEHFRQIRLIDAFNKTFILFYQIDYENKFINAIIVLLGMKKDAMKYMYDFTIISAKDNNARINFILPCCSDTENIEKYIEIGKCVCLPFHVAEAYCDNNKSSLSCSYFMKRKKNTEN